MINTDTHAACFAIAESNDLALLDPDAGEIERFAIEEWRRDAALRREFGSVELLIAFLRSGDQSLIAELPR